MQTYSRILIIKHGAFGDLVQALGALQDIRLAYPQAHITLLTSPQFGSLLARCPHVDGLLFGSYQVYYAYTPCYVRSRLNVS